jgi:hypothetical protein
VATPIYETATLVAVFCEKCADVSETNFEIWITVMNTRYARADFIGTITHISYFGGFYECRDQSDSLCAQG